MQAELHPDLAEKAVNLLYQRNPDLLTHFGPEGRNKCVDDTRLSLQFIDAAATADSAPLLLDYLGWLKVLFANLGFPPELLVESLRCLADVLAVETEHPRSRHAAKMLYLSLSELNADQADMPSHLSTAGRHTDLAHD